MFGRLYVILAWLITALGMLHMAATFRLPGPNPLGKIWFFGSGLAIALGGALNLLHRTYGQSCFGIRIVCRSANLLLTLVAIAAGTLMGATFVQRLVIWSLFVSVLILSCLPVQPGQVRRN